MGSTAIVGNTIPIAVGLGLSIQLQKTNNVSCVFFGDGAIEEGVFYESVNFAVVRNLPVLFICENNLYSVYSPLSVRQPKNRKIHEMVRAMGIQTTTGNGNDLAEVYEKTNSAVEKIKLGQGPQFIEFSTYRWLEHCGPNYDNTIGYRSEQEFLSWQSKDPLKHCEEKLLSLSASNVEKYHKDVQHEVDQAFEFAIASPFPDPGMAFTSLYAEKNTL